MKSVIFSMLILASATVQASQQGTVACYSQQVADAGYDFVTHDLQRATLSEQSFVGPRNPIEMECTKLMDTRPEPRPTDAPFNSLVCKDPTGKSNLIVRLFTGGMPGPIGAPTARAEVKKISDFDGMKMESLVQFGKLICYHD